jgi:hypothetical protein
MNLDLVRTYAQGIDDAENSEITVTVGVNGLPDWGWNGVKISFLREIDDACEAW